MLKSKKGFIDILFAGLIAILSNVWVLLGIAVFVIVMVLLSFFMLGKIMGAVLVLGGLYLFTKLDWRVALVVLLLGIFFFWNPFGLEALQFVR